MSRQVKQWAIRARVELMTELGGKCAKCETENDLQFDCIYPQCHEHHRWSTDKRMTFYRRQHYICKNLQILCAGCNQAKSVLDKKILRSQEEQKPISAIDGYMERYSGQLTMT